MPRTLNALAAVSESGPIAGFVVGDASIFFMPDKGIVKTRLVHVVRPES